MIDVQMSRCANAVLNNLHIHTSAHQKITASGLCSSDNHDCCDPNCLLPSCGLHGLWPSSRGYVRNVRRCTPNPLQSTRHPNMALVPGHSIHQLVDQKRNILLRMTSGTEMIPSRRSALFLLKFSSVFVLNRYKL